MTDLASHWSKLKEEHFKPLGSEDSIRLFKSSVQLVEIEAFSYCNRTCWFCPNKNGSRLGKNTHMSPALYKSIIGSLESIEYTGTISYSRYNEPLSDKIILDHIAYARRRLPQARLHTNTNGDFLNHDYLLELSKAGLNTINIQIYLKNFETYDHEKVRAKAEKIIGRIEIDPTLIIDERDEWLEYRTDIEGLKIRLYGRNFANNGTSRGDAVDIHRDFVRSSPCLMPVWSMYIDYDGSVMPCCNLRSDIPEHANAVIGQLSLENNIFDIYGGEALASWRRYLVGFQKKDDLCKSCRFAQEDDTQERRALSEALLRKASAPGGDRPIRP